MATLPPIQGNQNTNQLPTVETKKRWTELNLDMSWTDSVCAMNAENEFLRTVQKVAVTTVLPILFLAAFEALVKNPAIFAYKLALVLVNKITEALFPSTGGGTVEDKVTSATEDLLNIEAQNITRDNLDDAEPTTPLPLTLKVAVDEELPASRAPTEVDAEVEVDLPPPPPQEELRADNLLIELSNEVEEKAAHPPSRESTPPPPRSDLTGNEEAASGEEEEPPPAPLSLRRTWSSYLPTILGGGDQPATKAPVVQDGAE